MPDFITSHVFDPKKPKLGDFHIKRMFLYPKFWNEFALPPGVNLNWTRLRFGDDSADANFRTKCGIYSFIVCPDIANHPHTSFLLYIGQTRRSIRERYGDYKRDVEKLASKSKRPHVTVMLQKWRKNLLFVYAPLMDANPTTQAEFDLIDRTENALIKGYLPAVNKTFRGEISEVGRAINNIVMGI